MRLSAVIALGIAAWIAISAVYTGIDEWQTRRSAAHEHERLQLDLKANKPHITETAQTLIAQQNYPQALDLLGIYDSLADPDLAAMTKRAKIGILKKDLLTVPAEQHERRLELLTSISNLDSSDPGIIEQRNHEAALVDKTRKAEEAKAARVRNQPDGWFCNELQKHADELVYRRELITRGGRLEFLPEIAKRRIQIGMNEFEVRCAWGPPQRINRTAWGDHQHNQWVYGDSTYVYMLDGSMTSFQDSR